MQHLINKFQCEISLTFLKFIPILMSLLMLIHVGFLILGYNMHFAELIAGCTALPCLIVIAFSNVLHFCWIHKAHIIYAVFVDYCINIHRNFGIPYVEYARLFVFLFGIWLFILTFIHMKTHHVRIFKKKNDFRRSILWR